MNAVHTLILAVGSLALVAVTIRVMIAMNRSERRTIERRRAEWRAAGSIPDDERNFYSGSDSGGSLGG